MGYYDPPDPDDGFLGCPCCLAEEEQTVENDDGELICSECNTNVNWAYDNKHLWSELPDNYYDRTCLKCGLVMNWSETFEVVGLYDDAYPCCAEHVSHFEGVVQAQREEERLFDVALQEYLWR